MGKKGEQLIAANQARLASIAAEVQLRKTKEPELATEEYALAQRASHVQWVVGSMVRLLFPRGEGIYPVLLGYRPEDESRYLAVFTKFPNEAPFVEFKVQADKIDPEPVPLEGISRQEFPTQFRLPQVACRLDLSSTPARWVNEGKNGSLRSLKLAEVYLSVAEIERVHAMADESLTEQEQTAEEMTEALANPAMNPTYAHQARVMFA